MELSHQIYHTLCLPDMVERITSTIFSMATVTLLQVLSSGRDRTSTHISLGVLLVWDQGTWDLDQKGKPLWTWVQDQDLEERTQLTWDQDQEVRTQLTWDQDQEVRTL